MKKIMKFTAALMCIMFLITMAFVGCKPSESTSGTTIPMSTEPVAFDCFINVDWFPCSQWVGIIPEEITKRTGVTINPTICVDYAQLGVLIASGDLPDLVLTGEKLSELSCQDLCYSYDELIAKYCPDWKPDPVSIATAKTFSQDDKYYTILNVFDGDGSMWKNVQAGVPQVPTLTYREDMLAKLNMPLSSIEDLESIYDEIVANHKDWLALSFNEYHKLRIFKVWLGAQDTDWVEEDGKVKFTINGKNYKKYIQWVNKAYRSGWILEDNFAGTEEAMPPSENHFSMAYVTQNMCWFENSSLQEIDKSYHMIECMPLTDEPYTMAALGWTGNFVTRNCKDPGRAIQYIRWIFSDEGDSLAQWGREGIDYTMSSAGLPVFSEHWLESSKDEYAFYEEYGNYFCFGRTSLRKGLGRAAAIPSEEYDKYYAPVYKAICNSFFNYPWLAAAVPKAGTDEAAILGKLKDLVNTEEITIALSKTDAEFEANYKNMMDIANQIGLAELEEFMSKNVPEVKNLFK